MNRRTCIGFVDSVGRACSLEALEPRALLSFSWTPEEIYLTELVNRARANPLAEGVRLGLDLTASLTQAEAARLVPSEPLALNPALTVAARLHSQDMADRDFFDHVNPDGLDPTARATAAGYGGSAGENIAAGYETIDAAHRAWMQSVGHRKNVLSLHANFDSSFHYDEFGPGFAFTNIAPFYDYYSEEFGVQGGTPAKFLLGVVYTDTNGNAFYNIGEGLPAVRIDVSPSTSPQTVVATYTTDAAGNYQLALAAGSYTVTFTNMVTGLVTTKSAIIGEFNVKVDALASELSHAPGGGNPIDDDHRDAGQWTLASAIFIDPASGDGSIGGVIESAGDSDLFRFTVAGSGALLVTLVTPGSTLTPSLRLFGASFNPLDSGQAAGDGTDLTIAYSVVQGQTYYLLVEGTGGATGSYGLMLNGAPAPQGSGGGLTPGDPNPYVAAESESVFASSLAAGRLTLTTINNDGRAVIFQQGGNGWQAWDLLSLSGGPGGAHDPVTFTDVKDNLTYVTARSPNGLLLFTNAADGSWSVRSLTAEITGSEAIVNEPTVFTTTDGVVCIAGLTESGDLVVYQQWLDPVLGGHAGHWAWKYVNITQRDLAPNGLSTPAFTGRLISYVTAWNGLNIAGLDANGDIQVVWTAPGMTAWTVNNLSEITGAPPISGGLTAYLTSWKGINLSGTALDGQLVVTWWVPQFEGVWRNDSLTAVANGPHMSPGSVSSYVTPWGGLNVVGQDEVGRIVVYWWSPDMVAAFGSDAWRVDVLSDTVNAAVPRPTGRLAGIAAGSVISIVGAADNGDVVRFFWQIGGAWDGENISEIVAPQ